MIRATCEASEGASTCVGRSWSISRPSITSPTSAIVYDAFVTGPDMMMMMLKERLGKHKASAQAPELGLRFYVAIFQLKSLEDSPL